MSTAVSQTPAGASAASAPAHAESNALIKPGYHPRLTNEDLAPLKKQTWGQYNIFAFWMSDVHSVGGYITAGSLFALGLSSWQVLVSLLVGIVIVQIFCNLVAKPSQVTGTPYPVMCRASFGVLGANIPAIIRGLIAVAWYGVQTYLASAAFMVMWVLQAFVFWHGMDAIRKFIDWAGPAVYVVMAILCGWLVWKAGWKNIDLNLGGIKFQGWDALPVMLSAIALVVSYFSGPMLNFGDFSRYGKSFDAVKKGNFWGLPINFVFFSLLTVITTATTLPVFGELITDPVHTVGKIDSTTAVVLGALTFMIATIGINIVANFVSPAFDFSNVAPQHISWRTGGMIAAVGSVFLTPWNLYNSPEVIHYTLDVLGSFIGPLFGILIADYYLVRKQQIDVDALYSMSTQGKYWYSGGYNPKAIQALIPSAIVPILCVMVPTLRGAANYAWFIGMALGFVIYALLNRNTKS